MVACGCRPQPGIEENEVTPLDPSSTQVKKTVVAKERILGAIVPAGGDGGWWFFKMMGPTDAIEAQRKQFEQFIESLRFLSGEESPIVWTAPENWIQAPPSKMAFAAFTVKTGGDPLRLTVSQATGSLLANINRWRNQVGLESLALRELESGFQKRVIHGRVVLVLDIAGPGGGTGMGGMPPGNLPPGHPPVPGAKQ